MQKKMSSSSYSASGNLDEEERKPYVHSHLNGLDEPTQMATWAEDG